MTRAFLLLLHLLLLTTNALDVSDAPDARYGAHKWTLLRGVEGTLRGTSSFVRGVGDTIAVSAGGAIRALGGIVNDAGGGLEGLGNAVTGEQGEEDDQKMDAALRSVAGRPIRLVGRALRAVGDTTNFLGDTTERIAGEVAGIVPDTVRVVESGVRTLRQKIDGDELVGVPDAYLLEAGAGTNQRPGDGPTLTGLKLSSSGRPQRSEADMATASTATGAATAVAPTAHEASPRRSVWKRLDFLWPASSSGLRGHVLLALATVAIGARSSAFVGTHGVLGVTMLVVLALLYVGTLVAQVEAEQREVTRREVVASERHALYHLNPRLPFVAEPTGWLNAILASGWAFTIQPYLLSCIRREMDATLKELPLPKSLKSIELADLYLGRRPPSIRSLAAVPADGPTREITSGCLLQAEVDWEAPDASATLTFKLSNVATMPSLRVRRVRLRGTLQLHWEWLTHERWTPDDQLVGTLRFAFVRPPEVADFALEPMGSIDVTTLPGLGAWVKDSLNSAIIGQATIPNWVETDMRIDVQTLAALAAIKAEAAAAAAAAAQVSKMVAAETPQPPTPSVE